MNQIFEDTELVNRPDEEPVDTVKDLDMDDENEGELI